MARAPIYGENMVKVMYRMPETMRDDLKRVAAESGEDASKVLRKLIASYLQRNNRKTGKKSR